MSTHRQKSSSVQYSRKKEQEKLHKGDEEELNAVMTRDMKQGEANIFLLLTLSQRFLVWMVNKCKYIFDTKGVKYNVKFPSFRF